MSAHEKRLPLPAACARHAPAPPRRAALAPAWAARASAAAALRRRRRLVGPACRMRERLCPRITRSRGRGSRAPPQGAGQAAAAPGSAAARAGGARPSASAPLLRQTLSERHAGRPKRAHPAREAGATARETARSRATRTRMPVRAASWPRKIESGVCKPTVRLCSSPVTGSRTLMAAPRPAMVEQPRAERKKRANGAGRRAGNGSTRAATRSEPRVTRNASSHTRMHA